MTLGTLLTCGCSMVNNSNLANSFLLVLGLLEHQSLLLISNSFLDTFAFKSAIRITVLLLNRSFKC
eukprot:snap_masked-scaffold_33-processed-gene-2.43-mRNA-1 protein AED:1.00 eAED:1.00 QI:0/0/0/0/1/1/2/0/65